MPIKLLEGYSKFFIIHGGMNFDPVKYAAQVGWVMVRTMHLRLSKSTTYPAYT